MTDNKSKSEEWIDSIEQSKDFYDKQRYQEKPTILKFADDFVDIIHRIRKDFDALEKEQSKVTVFAHNDRDMLEMHEFSALNPTNHTEIPSQLRSQISNVLSDIVDTIQYVKETYNNFQGMQGKQMKQLLERDITESLLESSEKLFSGVVNSLLDSKTLDLREDYPAYDALSRKLDHLEESSRLMRIARRDDAERGFK